MSVRTKAALVIIATNLIIIVFSVTLGLFSVTRNNEESIEENLTLTAQLADGYISGLINNLALDANLTIDALVLTDGQNRDATLNSPLSAYG